MTSQVTLGDKKQTGFTLIEVLIIMAIVITLSLVAIPISNNIQIGAQLNDSSSGIIQAIRTAQNQANAGLNNSSHGVYFDINPSGTDSYILYQGDSYSTRNSDYDRIFLINSSIELSTTLTGDEITFSKNLGKPDKTGSISLSHESGDTRSMSINSFGLIDED